MTSAQQGNMLDVVLIQSAFQQMEMAKEGDGIAIKLEKEAKEYSPYLYLAPRLGLLQIINQKK